MLIHFFGKIKITANAKLHFLNHWQIFLVAGKIHTYIYGDNLKYELTSSMMMASNRKTTLDMA